MHGFGLHACTLLGHVKEWPTIHLQKEGIFIKLPIKKIKANENKFKGILRDLGRKNNGKATYKHCCIGRRGAVAEKTSGLIFSANTATGGPKLWHKTKLRSPRRFLKPPSLSI